MAAAFFYLVGDNRTATLALTPPTWGRPLTGLPASGGFQMSDWHDLPHVVLYRLARHQARVREPSRATCCVVASPMGSRHPTADERSECRPGIAERLASLGEHHCPGRPLVIIGGPDADGSGTALCNGLWGPHRSCARGLADPIVRVTGNVPGLQSEVAGRGARGLCRRLVTPYLSHARTPLAAANTGSVRRSLRIAYAAASWGHVDADAHGFVAWRKALRNACKALDTTQCQWVWISMSGNGAEKAIQRYSDADFCLQPPGDTLPRPGIMDAISVGCVPVRFHPARPSTIFRLPRTSHGLSRRPSTAFHDLPRRSTTFPGRCSSTRASRCSGPTTGPPTTSRASHSTGRAYVIASECFRVLLSASECC